MLNLESVFGSELEPKQLPVATTTVPVPGNPAVLSTTVGPRRPHDTHVIDAWFAAEDFSRWTYRDGRYIGPNANPADDFDELPEPGGPCPTCNSLDFSVDILGGRHCRRCEADKLARSRRIVDRAKWLWKRAPADKTASPVARGCEETRADDTQHVGSPRPSTAALEPLRGCEGG